LLRKLLEAHSLLANEIDGLDEVQVGDADHVTALAPRMHTT
jgi:hypothetical protein